METAVGYFTLKKITFHKSKSLCIHYLGHASSKQKPSVVCVRYSYHTSTTGIVFFLFFLL